MKNTICNYKKNELHKFFLFSLNLYGIVFKSNILICFIFI